MPSTRIAAFAFVTASLLSPLSDRTRASEPAETEVSTSNENSLWRDRLLHTTEQMLNDKSLKQQERFLATGLTCSALGRAGHSEKAVQIAMAQPFARERRAAMTYVVAAQSERDDVVGALATVERIEDRITKQRALVLLVARQAQRDDFADALALIPHIGDHDHRDNALKLIISSYLKQDAFSEASWVAERILDPNVRRSTENEIQKQREEPTPADPDYIERTIARAKETWDFIGFSDSQAEFLRRTCQVKIAIHRQDRAAFAEAMEAMQEWADEASGSRRRNAMLQIGLLYHQFGETDQARSVFDDVLANLITPSQSIDWVRIFLPHEETFEKILQLQPKDKLEQLVEDWAAVDNSGHVIGEVVAEMIEAGETEVAERMFASCRTPEQRLWVAAAALSERGR